MADQDKSKFEEVYKRYQILALSADTYKEMEAMVVEFRAADNDGAMRWETVYRFLGLMDFYTTSVGTGRLSTYEYYAREGELFTLSRPHECAVILFLLCQDQPTFLSAQPAALTLLTEKIDETSEFAPSRILDKAIAMVTGGSQFKKKVWDKKILSELRVQQEKCANELVGLLNDNGSFFQELYDPTHDVF